MRIDTNQTIAGYPARKVRQLTRETLGRPVTNRCVCETLGCCTEMSGTVLAELQREGWICQVGDHLEPSLQGSAFAQATAAKPLTRATAHKLVADVVGRARAVNRQEEYAYAVQQLVVFGSYSRNEPRLNDVDIGVRLVPRWSGDVQTAAEHRRRDCYPGGFRNTSHWAIWPKLEVMRFLKSRSRGLSIQEMNDWIENNTEHHVIYSADGRR